jgi:hypothetical protein
MSIGENALGVNNNLFVQMNVQHPMLNQKKKINPRFPLSPLGRGLALLNGKIEISQIQFLAGHEHFFCQLKQNI